MPKQKPERELQNIALTAFSKATFSLEKESERGYSKANVLALLGIGYALTDLADQMTVEEDEEYEADENAE